MPIWPTMPLPISVLQNRTKTKHDQIFPYDLVVIGSGPAGEGAAMNAVKQGWRVAVVDERALAGGSCTHLGTIPSKALRQSSSTDDAVQHHAHVPGRG